MNKKAQFSSHYVNIFMRAQMILKGELLARGTNLLGWLTMRERWQTECVLTAPYIPPLHHSLASTLTWYWQSYIFGIVDVKSDITKYGGKEIKIYFVLVLKI
jgi:hypothetical protein